MNKTCRYTTIDRRRWLLSAGLLTPFGLVRRATASPAPARSVLFLFAGGGMSQLDTLDPKPAAPVEIRGAFDSIATTIPGVRFGEGLPLTAQRSQRFTVIRSLNHDDLDHGSASYATLTGRFHARKSSNPPPRPDDAPTAGAIVARVRGAGPSLAASVQVNGPMLVPREVGPGQNAGLLGRTYDPLLVGDVREGVPLLADLTPPEQMSLERIQARRDLLLALEDGAILPHYQRAYELLDQPRCRSAFDLDQESARLRERYGRTRMGQACLLGRRLVEAGVPWVTVFLNHTIRGQDVSDDGDACGWDTHNDIFDHLRERLLPRFDQAFSALLDDMTARGLLDDTLVILAGEFGRAPRVAVERNFSGTSPGRKHWGACYSAIVAGASVPAGGVYGASDRIAAYPQDRPCGPADLLATGLAALGIDPTGEYQDATGRPYPISLGRPLFGSVLESRR